MIEYLKSLFSKTKCTHRFRCVHGDEINYLRGARSVCLKCGRPGEYLPFYCFYTKEIHHSYEAPGKSPFGPDDYFKMDP